ncbi:MAG: phosphoesterase [Pseudomonadota bacterium]
MSEELKKDQETVEAATPKTTTEYFSDFDRRDVLKAGVATSALAAGATTMGSASAQPGLNLAGRTFGQSPISRAIRAFRIRNNNALSQFRRFRAMTGNFQRAVNSGDESLYSDFRGSYSKSLLHNEFGEVDPTSFGTFLKALNSRRPSDFENIIVGDAGNPDRIGLVDPQAAYDFDQSAIDSNGYRMPAAPTFASDETAAEMGELYWYALTRDIPFTNYDTSPLIQRASDDLNNFTRSDIFPNTGGTVTPQSIFRGTFAGAEVGPFVSQVLLKPFMFGRAEVVQRYNRPTPGSVNDFMTDYDEWLAIQNGTNPSESTTFSGQNRFISSMRGLAEWVHVDFPIQSPLYAFLIFSAFGQDALDPNIPFGGPGAGGSPTEVGFTSWGGGGLPHLILQASRIGLLGAWYQKWGVHRRLRPEVYAGRINNQLRGRRTYDINQEILDSECLSRIVANAATADDVGLLPMAYPEGSPTHPAYPGGHSTFVAAGATVCKAIFNEDFVIPDPVVANAQGTQLDPFVGPDLTIGGELNKLVGNVTHGRDGAGMHWRSDGRGNFIGENVAITLLADYSRTYNTDFDGFQLTRFDGTPIRIVNGQVLAN